MILEDDFSEAVEVHERSILTFDKLLSMPLLSDSPAVKAVIVEALDDVKMCKMATQQLISKFTSRSKQKYVLIKESKEPEE
jgi:hypothetical protein